MKKDTKTTITQRIIQEEVPNLVLTFTPEEVKALLAIGGTSHVCRVKFLSDARGPHNYKEKNEECSNLLAEVYFAAADFNRSLAGS
jgi:hypothetical protein